MVLRQWYTQYGTTVFDNAQIRFALMADSTPANGDTISIPVSPGELIDKITILEIKAQRVNDPVKRKNVGYELALLSDVRARNLSPREGVAELEAQLKTVNERLWDVEDDIRRCEAQGDFGPGFVELARKVYRTNDRRAALKREICTLFGSAIVEEKSYAEY